MTRILRYLADHLYLLYLVLALTTLGTLGLTLMPQETFSGSELFKYDKLGHFLMFGAWTFVLGLTLFVSGQRPLPLFSIFLAGSLFGITVEILQEVLPTNRNMDPMDALADIAGCAAAALLLKFLTIYAPEEEFSEKI